MKSFSQLITALEQTTKTTLKVDALEAYLRDASQSDRLWCLALFMGRRPKRSVSTTVLREWASEVSGLPLWLLEETYAVVGDLAETIALILPQDGGQASDSLSDIIHQIQKHLIGLLETQSILLKRLRLWTIIKLHGTN